MSLSRILKILFLIILIAVFASAQDTKLTKETVQAPPDPWRSKTILLDKPLDRTSPSILLKDGSIRDLQNMKRPGPGIAAGWTRRSGTTKHNTSAISGHEIENIWQFVQKDIGTRCLYAQINDLIYSSGIDPPATGASFGSSVYTLKTNAGRAFADSINDDWVGAASGTSPWAASGNTAYPDGFRVKRNLSENIYHNGYDKVRNNDDDTYILFLEAESGASEVYIGYRRRLDGFYLDFLSGNINNLASGITVYAYRSGSWTAVSGTVDGTVDITGTTTFSKDGSITWTASAADDPYVLPGTEDHLFWYKLVTTADVTNGIKVKRVLVNDYCQDLTNLWDGEYHLVSGAVKSTATGYIEYSGEVTDTTWFLYADLSELTTSYAFFVGFTERMHGIRLNMVPDYANTGTAAGVTVYYWDGDAHDFTAVTASLITDGTASGLYALAQTGLIFWDGSGFTEDERQLGGVPGDLYWYKLEWDATLPADIRIWEVSGAKKPEAFPHYDGVVEFNARAIWWPGDENKSALDYSKIEYPHMFEGHMLPMFGPGKINAVIRLTWGIGLVSTENPHRLFILEGAQPSNFDSKLISDHVGTVAPHSMISVNDAIKLFSQTLNVHAALFLAPDGFYMTDSRTVQNISQPIADYFDLNSAPYIEPDYMHLCHAWVDYNERTVHFAVPINMTGSGTQTTCNYELVYSYLTNEWWDVYKREAPAACGIDLVGSDEVRYSYIGDYAGGLFRTNYGDDDYGNNIDHHIKTTDIPLLAGQIPDFLNYSAILRTLKPKFKAQSSGSVDISIFPDGKTLGYEEGSISMVNSGYGYAMDRIDLNRNGESFAFKFRSGQTSIETMEMYGFSVDYRQERDTQ